MDRFFGVSIESGAVPFDKPIIKHGQFGKTKIFKDRNVSYIMIVRGVNYI